MQPPTGEAERDIAGALAAASLLVLGALPSEASQGAQDARVAASMDMRGLRAASPERALSCLPALAAHVHVERTYDVVCGVSGSTSQAVSAPRLREILSGRTSCAAIRHRRGGGPAARGAPPVLMKRHGVFATADPLGCVVTHASADEAFARWSPSGGEAVALVTPR